MIRISNLRYSYGSSGFQLSIPRLEVSAATKVGIVGPSGSGKTTLLNLISGAKVPKDGEIVVGDVSVSSMSDSQRRNFRASQIGFVFQDFELLDYLTVEENVRLPFGINSHLKFGSEQRELLKSLASQAGIADKLNRRPDQLSQGERQRVAICRALITAPKIVLADEPTGSLDPQTAQEVLNLLIDQVSKHSATLLMVTHDHSLLHRLDRTIDMAEFLNYSVGNRVTDAQSREVSP